MYNNIVKKQLGNSAFLLAFKLYLFDHAAYIVS